MTADAIALLDALAVIRPEVWQASNGRWYVTGKARQFKASAVEELLAAGHLVPCGQREHAYRRKADG